MSARRWIVVLSNPCESRCYLGELDRGVRSGVRQLENAVRFTKVGAARVAAQYLGATILDTRLPAATQASRPCRATNARTRTIGRMKETMLIRLAPKGAL